VTWVFLGVAGVKAIQADQIDTYGGSHGLRDEGLLASAVMRAENKATFDPEATLASIGAALSFGLVKNHAFIDGNKRVGLGALVDFLALNGYTLVPSQDEQIATIWKVASSEITESDFAAWVERNIAPL
jgi:death-on-curing protein